jgi:hypothetical protein
METFISLGKLLDEDVGGLTGDDLIEDTERVSGTSLDVSKAFKKFTNGDRAILGVCEDIGIEKMVLFAALRAGRKVAYVDLTKETIELKQGDLKLIKEALKQAKQVNDEIYFSITNEE